MEILFVVQCLSSLRKTDSISVLMIFYSLHFFAHISFILTHWKNCLLGKKREINRAGHSKYCSIYTLYYIMLVLKLLEPIKGKVTSSVLSFFHLNKSVDRFVCCSWINPIVIWNSLLLPTKQCSKNVKIMMVYYEF